MMFVLEIVLSTLHTSQWGRVSEYWKERENLPFESRLSSDVPVIHCCYAVSGADVRRG